jgi:Putative auto-transporter adhesin, head GIN domain
MTRTLVLIAFSGFILAVACIAGALALGGGVLLHHHWGGHHWTVDWDDGHRHWRDDEHPATAGVSTTREIAWPGGDRIEFDVPGDVQYTQGPGPAKLIISGPKDQVDHVELSGGVLHSDDDVDFDGGRITVTMTAPDVRHFAINGDNSLVIGGYDQSDLAVDVSGNGKVSAKGKTRAIRLDVSGNGDIDLSGLAAQSADAQISGSGRASLAPTDEANLSISGSGEIDLLTHPAKLNSDVSGSGRVVEGAAAPAAAQAPTPPPPQSPALPARARPS